MRGVANASPEVDPRCAVSRLLRVVHGLFDLQRMPEKSCQQALVGLLPGPTHGWCVARGLHGCKGGRSGSLLRSFGEGLFAWLGALRLWENACA
jgi:hypothetical protein